MTDANLKVTLFGYDKANRLILAVAMPGIGPNMAVAQAISGAVVAAFSNAFSQFMEIFAGKRQWSDFSVTSFLVSMAIGAFGGLVGGAFMPGSKLWYRVMSYDVPMLRDLWQAVMIATVVGGFIGGVGDVASAIVRRVMAIERATASDEALDYERQICVAITR